MNNKEYEYKYGVILHILRSMRKELFLNQEQIAHEMGVTQSYISKLERGVRRMDIIEFLKYCEAARFSLKTFFERYEWKLKYDDMARKRFLK